jgi:hypothetical protein
MFAGLTALALIVGSIGVTPAAAAEQGNVSVVLIPQDDTAAVDDGVDTYRIVVTNQGGGEVKNIAVNIPFTAGYQVASTSFDRSNAWVARLGSESLDLNVVQMRGNGDSVSGTLRFVGGDATNANAVVERATVTWSGDTRSPQNASNLPVSLQEGSVGAATVPGNRPGYSFSATAFASNEPVSLWYTDAAGVSTPLLVLDGVALPEPQANDEERSYGTALPTNAQGQLQALIDLRGVAPGTYTIAAQGGWSGTTAFATLIVR